MMEISAPLGSKFKRLWKVLCNPFQMSLIRWLLFTTKTTLRVVSGIENLNLEQSFEFHDDVTVATRTSMGSDKKIYYFH